MRVRRKKKKRILIVLLLFLIIIGAGSYYGYTKYEEKIDKEKKEKLRNEISSHYSKLVKVDKDSKLYDSEGKEIGLIGKDVELTLSDQTITSETTNLKIEDFENAYISYKSISKIDKLTEYDTRYKNYIPFNTNVKTNDKTSFYDESGNIVYTINKSFDLPIIIKEDKSYGVEFKDRLLFINKEDVKETYEKKNTDKHNTSGVPVLNYHFVYDDADSKQVRDCNEEICTSKTDFKRQLDHINDRGLWPIKMQELERYMDGKLQLPKSILITFDDGGWTDIAIDVLEEYKMYATFFLITSWFDPKDYKKTAYTEFHSHSHNLHNGGQCPGGQGAPIKCIDKDKILEDLKKTREALGGSTAFCYPFYEFNSYSEGLLKEAGFTMAFIGEVPASYGPYKLAEVGGNKMQIPRFVVVNYTTLYELDRCFNEIR